MSEIIVHRFQDLAEVAEKTASALIDRLIALQKVKGEIHLMLTGGTVGIATLSALRKNSLSSSVNFKNIHFWWGDDRFVASDHEDRNALQARSALLSYLDLDPKKIHEFPAAENSLQLDDAAKQFAETVRSIKPRFDIVLLGMGPDGHVASLFPDKPTPKPGAMILAEHDSPKPPSQRLTFSYEAINSAAEVWLVVAGSDKQNAVAVAMSDSAESLPVGRVHGSEKTQWFLDSTAGKLAFGG